MSSTLLDSAAGPQRRRNARAIAAILVLTALCYAPAIGGYFLGDDLSFLAFVSGRSEEGTLGRTLLKGFIAPPERGENFYRPVLDLSYAIDFTLWGTRAEGWHLTNLLVHLANTLLLASLLRRLLQGWAVRDSWAPAAAGALFALSPLAPESVVWISGRSDLFALLGSLGAVVAYVHSPRWRSVWGVTSLLAFAFGLASKEAAITTPAWIAALHLAGWRGGPRRALAGAGPFALLALAYLGMRQAIFDDPVTVLRHADPIRWTDPGWLTRRWEALRIFGRSSAAPGWEGDVAGWLTVVLLVLSVLAASRSVPARRLGTFATLWLGSTLLPLVRYLWIAPDGEGARLLYIPMAALATLLCAPLAASGEGAGRTLERSARAALSARLAVGLALLWASVSGWASAGREMNSVVAEIREVAERNEDPTQIFLVLPDALGPVFFARNGMGPLMGPPVQPESLETELLVMTAQTAPGHLRARSEWDRGLARLHAFCWNDAGSEFEPMEVPADALIEPARLGAAAAAAGCDRIATEF